MKQGKRVPTFLKPLTKKCKLCDETFEISPESQKKYADKGLSLPSNCPACRDKKKVTAYTTNCKDCGIGFTVTAYEEELCEKKGWNKPVRCQACREKRKAEKEAGKA
jgi:hypothetical protein